MKLAIKKLLSISGVQRGGGQTGRRHRASKVEGQQESEITFY